MQAISPVACDRCASPAAQGWQLPEHEFVSFAPRRNRYAAIIPVWNEGERLRAQLARVQPLLDVTDIFVTDAESTDGSTAAAALALAGVRERITVFARGVGLALRPAIAHALLDGYDGVILMDGNGKDDAGMLATLAVHLDAGADYVQGSRYIQGGRGINTPKVREVLIRAVHSPLYSLACGRWFTDSTIGTRAFSRRFLVDPRVLPFRDRFRYYDLYFYLGWRACRLGFRVADAPVTRAYPDHGPTPTKIKSAIAYWRMIGPLFGLILGRYR